MVPRRNFFSEFYLNRIGSCEPHAYNHLHNHLQLNKLNANPNKNESIAETYLVRN